jgi:His/Glu/Gln/Arg/opine family amino acid ABC transporter permease subunit
MGFWSLFLESLSQLLQGLLLTLELAGISLAVAMVIGMLAAMMGLSRYPVLRLANSAFVTIIRCSPLLVQTFFIYFGITGALGVRMDAFTAGVISLSLNAGGYLSEIFRGGIQAVNKGQVEAALSLGFTSRKTMRLIVLPQAIRICLPSVVNQWCITIKDT